MSGLPGRHASPLLPRFADWLTALGEAWEATDAERLAGLFALGATFAPAPFAELVRGRRAIGDHWRRELDGLREVQFSAQVLGVGDTYGIAHWRASLLIARTRRTVVRDGILLAAFDERGRCTSLRLWSHSLQGEGEA